MIGAGDVIEGNDIDDNNNEEEKISDMASKTPFEVIKLKMFDITPNKDGGVLKRKLIPGSGILIPNGARVRS